jgi:ribosomal protein S18 acetylase RimI-like enzyme
MYAVWNDYFNNDISKCSKHIEPIEILKVCDCKDASEVTLSCTNQSRGFSGQTETWMRQWIEGLELNAVALGSKNCAVLIHRENNHIVGVVCIAIYGHESERGPTLWIREIAIRPEYQGRGMAKKLLNQALFYGESHGAKRAFLMADELNENAIRLYESIGFTANKDEAENDMILI